MSNGEVFIVAKPHFERTSSGQSEISIVDVWVVPDNGQGRVPTNIDDRRADTAPRCNTTQDPQRFYQPLTSQYLNNSFQHMTLVRTPRGWEIQQDVDQRRYSVPRMSPPEVDQRFSRPGFRSGHCGCYSERPAYMEQTPAYMEQRPQFRVQVEPPYSSVDPRFRVQTNPQYRPEDRQYRPEDQRVSQINYQRQYQIELQRMPDAELQRRYEVLMERRQTERERMIPQKINPRLPEAEYKKQYQLEIQRRNQVEVQRRVDAELQRTFEVEMRRRINQQRTQSQPQTQGEWNPNSQDDLQRRAESEIRRRYEADMQRRYESETQRRNVRPQQQELPQPTAQPQPRYQPQQARPQGRATYGVNPNIGLELDRRNQDMRRQVDQFEDGYWYNRQTDPQYRRQYQYEPQTQSDPTRWTPRSGNLRSWEDNLDFDPDGTKIPENVGKYLGRYGPTNQPSRNPNGVYGPSPLSPQGIIEGSVDSTLRSWGNYIRGK